jgi:CRISPR/Cas system-associated endoribonuclease Cas2
LVDSETKKPALCTFGSARQDSGKLEDYAMLMKFYATKAGCDVLPGLMASEIDERDTDFQKAIDVKYKELSPGQFDGYTLAGVGGALGDSEKIDTELVLGNEFIDKVHFAASEAAKITRVWGGNGKTGYTLKTGDSFSADKVTYDKKAEKDITDELQERAKRFQTFHKDALEAIRESSFEAFIEPLSLSQEELQVKQVKLDELLDRIITKRGPVMIEQLTSTGEDFRYDQNGQLITGGGGRRTRRRARKVTKKYVRKNIRKSKNKKSRRSYRRKSKK